MKGFTSNHMKYFRFDYFKDVISNKSVTTSYMKYVTNYYMKDVKCNNIIYCNSSLFHTMYDCETLFIRITFFSFRKETPVSICRNLEWQHL